MFKRLTNPRRAVKPTGEEWWPCGVCDMTCQLLEVPGCPDGGGGGGCDQKPAEAL